MGILIQISFSNCDQLGDHKDPTCMFQYIHVENRKRGIWGCMICKNEYGLVLFYYYADKIETDSCGFAYSNCFMSAIIQNNRIFAIFTRIYHI